MLVLLRNLLRGLPCTERQTRTAATFKLLQYVPAGTCLRTVREFVSQSSIYLHLTDWPGALCTDKVKCIPGGLCEWRRLTTSPTYAIRCISLLNRSLVCCWLHAVFHCGVKLAVARVYLVALLAHPFPLMCSPYSAKDRDQPENWWFTQASCKHTSAESGMSTLRRCHAALRLLTALASQACNSLYPWLALRSQLSSKHAIHHAVSSPHAASHWH